jgi:hypothetical protein
MDRSASYPIYIKGNLSQQELWSLRNYAIRRFYLDPAGILRKLLGCGSFFEFTNTLKQGVGIFKTLF